MNRAWCSLGPDALLLDDLGPAVGITTNQLGKLLGRAAARIHALRHKGFFDVIPHQQLIDSITQKLWPLGNDTAFVPGHGPMSTFGHERKTNAYVSDYLLS